MRLKSLRVAEFCQFFDGVALSELSPGLNVLIGPNEAGKSTLLRALSMLFAELHTAQNKSVKACRSWQGGAPLIEAEFELGGQVWRLAKRFLSGKSAELVSLPSDQTWRNADAEEHLARLLEAHSAITGARGLLWVEQTKSFSIPSGREQEQLHGSLAAFVRGEAEQVAGGEMLGRVRALVRSASLELVTTAKRQAKRGGPLFEAVADRDRLAGDLAAARQAVLLSEDRVKEFGLLRGRQQELASGERRARLRAEVEAAQHALEAARSARERLAASAHKVSAVQSAFDGKAIELQTFREKLAARAALEATVAARRMRQAEIGAELEAAEVHLTAVGQGNDRAGGDLAALEAIVRRAEAAGRLSLMRADQADLARRTAEAEQAQHRAADLERQLGAIIVSRDGVATLRRITLELAEIRAVRAAAATNLAVRYAGGASSGFSIEGKPLADRSEITIEQPLVVDVTGVGSLEITPGRSGELAELECRLAVLVERQAALLAQLGVPDLEASEAALAFHGELSGALAAALAQAAALAPHGLARLRSDLEKLDQRIETATAECSAVDGANLLGDHTSDEVTEARLRLAAVRQDFEAGKARVASASQRVQDLRLALNGETVAHQHDQRALDDIRSQLPPAGACDNHLAELTRQLDERRGELHAAVRDHDAWKEKAPGDETLERMARQFTELSDRGVEEARELQDIEVRMAALEARIEEHRENDVHVRAETLTEALVRAERRVEDLQLEADALALLEQEIAAAEAKVQERVLAPLMLRLGPMIGQVLDGAGAVLGGALGVDGLTRGQRLEPTDDLSDGTREQIAVMVRLAYARMFAERGMAMPLILDDALVFSDDPRLKAMFRLLQQAAEHHQVLVLTCHERGFLPLVEAFGARQLSLGPWGPEPVSRALSEPQARTAPLSRTA